MAKTRILLVDDFQAWRLATSRILSTVPDFQVVGEASDGLEAVAKSAALLPDIVLLDLAMPRLNGLEAAKRIRQSSPQSKIIFLTEEDDEDLRSAALGTGAVAYLIKSRAGRELQLYLDAAIRRSRVIPPSLCCPAARFSSP